jgi:tRNA dimethylallyltransferase
MSLEDKFLIVIMGPTASGKTDLTIDLARSFGSIVISADSRQFYREMRIGTSRPEESEMKGVIHFFMGHLRVTDYYSAGRFELDVISFLEERFRSDRIIFMTGGSGLYINAVCQGIDDTPEIDASLRKKIVDQFNNFGLSELLEKLRISDPEYYNKVDKNNPKRIMRAIEVIEQTGRPYSDFRKNQFKPRPFKIIKIGLELPRDILFDRINTRVDKMMKLGLVEEAMSLYPMRDQVALRTVGYEELFSYFDGKYDMEETIRLIKRNTRRYAKRQLTWFKKDLQIKWFSPEDYSDIRTYLIKETGDASEILS